MAAFPAKNFSLTASVEASSWDFFVFAFSQYDFLSACLGPVVPEVGFGVICVSCGLVLVVALVAVSVGRAMSFRCGWSRCNSVLMVATSTQ